MAVAEPLHPEPRLSKAALIIHSSLPLFVGAYYFIATFISYFTRSNAEDEKSPKKTLRKVLYWLVSGIPLIYAGEATILLYETYSNIGTPPRQDSIIYAIASSLLWFYLLTAFSDSSGYPGYRFYGCWVAYLAGEITLFCLGLAIAKSLNGLAATVVAFQALRVVDLVVVCGLTFGSQIIPPKQSKDEEESSPLLGSGSQCNNRANLQHTEGGDGSYGSISPNPSNPKPANCNTSSGSNTAGADSGGKVKNQNPMDYIRSFKTLLPYLWPSGKVHLQLLYVGIGLCLVVERVLNVLVPLQIGLITNILSGPHATFPLKEIVVFIVLRLLSSSGGVSAIRGYLWMPLGNYSYQRIGHAAFEKVMTLSSDFHDSKQSGSLWLSIARGQSIRHLVSSVLFQVGPMLVDLVLAISVLYYLFDIYMALIVAGVTITFLWSSGRILSLQKEKRRQWIDDLQKEENIMCESTSNWKTVSYFNRVPYEKSRYFSAMETHMRSRLVYKTWDQVESIFQSFLLISGLMGACFLAAYQVIQGNKPVGSFVMLLSYWAQLSSPLQFFASSFSSTILDLVDAEELLTLLKRQPTITDADNAKQMVLSDGEIQFRDVKFSYDNEREVVKDINFQAAPGQTVALVGETGGGKSTIMKLLFRFYDPKEGSIFIDGQDIRHVTLESLRAHIGVVPQDPTLFHDTIMNNIRYAKFDASDDEIFDACKAVALHEKFLSFPDGYGTLVGERGVKLSGGELQRVAIARAIVKSPKIVLLDEATSSVDSETEAQIQESLGALSTGRTTFVIAHRLSTIKNADKILVLQGGTIVEQGSHEALLGNKGRYYGLWSRQGFFEPPNTDVQIKDPVVQEDQADLIDTSDDKEAELPESSVAGPSADTSKINKVWKPEAPEFVPCKISRWKPTPSVPNSNLQSSVMSMYTPNKPVGEDLSMSSRLPTPARDSKENAPRRDHLGLFERNYVATPSTGRKHVIDNATFGSALKEPTGTLQNTPLGAEGAQVVQRGSVDPSRSKGKRVTRRNMSKSDPAGLNGGDGDNGSSPSFGSRESLNIQPSLGNSPALAANGDNSPNRRRRRRNRYSKNKSPRTPLFPAAKGAPSATSASSSTPFTGRFQSGPHQVPTGGLRFPPTTS
ncbi:hypothetical protein FQN54_008485 [Arachnomyces sp. PD_36]|nr:hypothetical protein FQN54_008485 [Arachnomyces sp. PD_36]